MPRAATSASKPAATALRFVGADGIDLCADARGAPGAPTVLFLHGGGQTRHAWAGSAEALAADGRYAVCLDLRGHGESGWADGDAGYRLARFADDLRCVLAQLDAQPVLVGASLGGLTSLLAVGESPGADARAAVLVDIAPRIETGGAQRISSFMLARPDGFESLAEVADAIAGYTKQRSRPRNLDSLRKNLRESEDGRFHWHWDPRFMGPDGPAEIAQPDRLFAAARDLSVPTLLVRGRESDILSEHGVREFLSHLPDAEFVDVGGAGHMVAGDRNDVFTEAVRGFLARVAPLS